MLHFVLWLAYLIDWSEVIKVGGKQKPYKMWQAGVWEFEPFLIGVVKEKQMSYSFKKHIHMGAQTFVELWCWLGISSIVQFKTLSQIPRSDL